MTAGEHWQAIFAIQRTMLGGRKTASWTEAARRAVERHVDAIQRLQE